MIKTDYSAYLRKGAFISMLRKKRLIYRFYRRIARAKNRDKKFCEILQQAQNILTNPYQMPWTEQDLAQALISLPKVRRLLSKQLLASVLASLKLVY